MNEDSKSRENYNDFYYNNYNYSNQDEKEEREIKEKKKTLKTYKYHMLHHNGFLTELKKYGINISYFDNIFSKNEDLFIELLKNNDQNALKKFISEILFQNNYNINKQELRINQNSINVSKSNNDNEINNQLKIKNFSQIKDKKYIKIDDFKKSKRNSNFSFNQKKIKTLKRYSLDSNRQNDNSLNNLNKNKLDENKNNTKIKKRRASVQILPPKAYLSIDENYNNINEEQMQKVDDSNSYRTSKFTGKTGKESISFQKIPINNNNYQKACKRNNSTVTHISNYSNNNYYVQNNENSLKNSLPIIRKTNKIFGINNNRKLHNKLKRNNSFQPYFIKGGVNFKKMLSRAYLDRISNNVENIYSTITPNYLAIHPKCIMNVTYKNIKYSKQRPAFKGLSADYTFDMDKIFFKYNNHIPPKAFEFHKMAGRGKSKENKLPSFMIAQFDRNSCNTFNEKNLKMNSFANGQLKQNISSFNDKKSFNYKLNDEINKKNNLDKEVQIEFENLVKTIFEQGIINNNESKTINDNENYVNTTEDKVINSLPFRIKTMYQNFMSEYKRKNNQGDRVDGITFKSFKNFQRSKKYCKEYNDF